MRSKLLGLVIVALCIVAPDCTLAGSAPEKAANKKLVREYMERVINEGDWSAWPEIFGDSVLFNGEAMSVEDVKGMLASFRSIFPDFHIAVESQIAEGDSVATRVTVSGTHQGDYMGMKATGKHVSFGGIAYDRIVDGKIVEMWHEMDIWGTLLMLDD